MHQPPPGDQPHRAEEAPEPLYPQGEYAPAGPPGAALEVASQQAIHPHRPPEAGSAPRTGGAALPPVELLAPAGGLDCGYAAFWYGADAIYLGLKKFSARAEAENFTLEEVEAITAFAHSRTPRRRVFVTLNTVIRQDEMAELLEALAALDEIGVDALIVQDLGVCLAVRRHFPGLPLHASTQMAIHNLAGAQALWRMGFKRVVLARELTLEEIGEITRASPIETEVFVHGALCYAYSGLCLFSSQTLGRSGNRGQCAYSCRDSFTVQGAPDRLRDGSPTKRDPRSGFPFSMKDLALPEHLDALREARVSSFKIEGRKKNALYVASTTDYYRRLLDGTLPAAERPALESDLQTVFSRPWTRLFLDSHKDKEVADRDTVGHRGARIGTVERVVGRQGLAWLRFRTDRRIERHDGIQIDLPKLGRPFGFSISALWVVEEGRGGERRREEFVAPAEALVEVPLPANYPPLPVDAPLYCASSQAVKQRYRFELPGLGRFRVQHALRVEGWLEPGQLRVRARLWDAASPGTPAAGGAERPPGAAKMGVGPRPDGPSGPAGLEASARVAGPFEPAKDPRKTRAAFQAAFEKLGGTALRLAGASLENPQGLFVPPSHLNALRREVVERIEEQLRRARTARIAELCSAPWAEAVPAPRDPAVRAPGPEGMRWSLKADRIGFLDDLEAPDWAAVDEVLLEIARDPLPNLQARLGELERILGRERIRLSLPTLTRKWEEKGLLQKIARLRAAGWERWEVGNLSGWPFLGADPSGSGSGLAGLDLAADWPLYAVNRAAVEQLRAMGIRRFALSPEDGRANIAAVGGAYPEDAVAIVYQDTPWFVAESCAYANLIGGCPGKANCLFENMELVSHHGERVLALDHHCRTIVLNQGAFCLGDRLADLAAAGIRNLRADFLYRGYSPSQVRAIWRELRAGRNVPGGHPANFDRGMQ